MSKTQQKSKSEIEHLRGENKRLKNENKQLRSRTNHLKKKAHFYENIVDEGVEEAELAKSCDRCGKGDLMILDLKFVSIEACTICDYKRNLKSGQET